MNIKRHLNLSGLTVLSVLIVGFFFAGPLVADEEKEDEATAFMGVSVKALDRQEKEELGLKWGVRVISVERKSAADQAGIEVDDILLAFNGEKLRRSFDLIELVGEQKPGTSVSVDLLRDKQKKTIKLILGERKAGNQRLYRFEKRKDSDTEAPEHLKWSSDKKAYMGVSIEEVEGDYAEYFSLKGKSGVLIRSLEKDGPADKGGLKAGDVIQQIGENRIESLEDVHKALEKLKGGERVDVSILRHGKSQTIHFELGEQDKVKFFIPEFKLPGFQPHDKGMIFWDEDTVRIKEEYI